MTQRERMAAGIDRLAALAPEESEALADGLDKWRRLRAKARACAVALAEED